MWKKAPYVLSLGLVALLVTVQLRPSEYRIERTQTIAAAPAAVYARIADLRAFHLWSPWEPLDGKAERTFDGPTEGLGATYRFRGDAALGQGRITLAEAAPPTRALYRVEFEKPWRTLVVHRFQLAPGPGETTKLTWSVEGKHHFWGKLFAMFSDVDRAVGDDMLRGLTSFERLVERTGSS